MLLIVATALKIKSVRVKTGTYIPSFAAAGLPLRTVRFAECVRIAVAKVDTFPD
jgi:hypothetical protein